MVTIIVDSDILIDLERERRRPGELGSMFPNDELAIAAITIAEVLVAAFRADSPQRRRMREEFADRLSQELPVIPFDVPVARQYAAIWAQLAMAGQLIGVHDMVIAATALTYGHAVLTRNLQDFTKVPGLTIQPPNL